MRSSSSSTITLLVIALAGCGVQSIPESGNAVDAAWGEVQNQYQRRADLIPNLVATVKGFATQESSVLEAVTAARARATSVNITPDKLDAQSMQQFERVQGQLSGALSRLLVASEHYPELTSNQNFRDLQAQLEGTENRIAIARRRYIEAVQQYNNVLTVPPTSITNSMFYHRQPKPQFTATADTADKPPAVKF